MGTDNNKDIIIKNLTDILSEAQTISKNVLEKLIHLQSHFLANQLDLEQAILEIQSLDNILSGVEVRRTTTSLRKEDAVLHNLRLAYPSLDKRELLVCLHIFYDRKNFDISKTLHISEKTVDKIRQSIRKKMECKGGKTKLRQIILACA